MRYLADFKEFISYAISLAGGISQLAKNVGVSDRAVYAWRKGERLPSKKILVKISSYVDATTPVQNKSYTSTVSTCVNNGAHKEAPCKPHSSALLTNNEFMQVPLLHQQQTLSLFPHISFSTSWLKDNFTDELGVSAHTMTTNNMHPTIPSGSTVLINTRASQLCDGKIYLLSNGEDYFIRRVFLTLDGIVLRNDNQEYAFQDKKFANKAAMSSVTVIGKVQWVGTSL